MAKQEYYGVCVCVFFFFGSDAKTTEIQRRNKEIWKKKKNRMEKKMRRLKPNDKIWKHKKKRNTFQSHKLKGVYSFINVSNFKWCALLALHRPSNNHILSIFIFTCFSCFFFSLFSSTSLHCFVHLNISIKCGAKAISHNSVSSLSLFPSYCRHCDRLELLEKNDTFLCQTSE